MITFQSILVYITLALAVGYIAKKFFLPRRLFASKGSKSKGCGQDDCGCH